MLVESIFLMDRENIAGPDGKTPLLSYEKLKERDQFSEEILTKMMSDLSLVKIYQTPFK